MYIKGIYNLLCVGYSLKCDIAYVLILTSKVKPLSACSSDWKAELKVSFIRKTLMVKRHTVSCTAYIVHIMNVLFHHTL